MVNAQLPPESIELMEADKDIEDTYPEYYVIVVPTIGLPRQEGPFKTLDAMVARLRKIVENKERCSVFPFRGVLFNVTTAPHHLVMPPDRRVPLFYVPDNTEIDPTGRLYDELEPEKSDVEDPFAGNKSDEHDADNHGFGY